MKFDKYSPAGVTSSTDNVGCRAKPAKSVSHWSHSISSCASDSKKLSASMSAASLTKHKATA